MELLAVSFKHPSLRFSNADILDAIRQANRSLALSEVEAYCNSVERLLSRAGARSRYFRNSAEGETALGLMAEAVRHALESVSLAPEALDLLIFCGVGRGFLEPANAAFLCRRLGLRCQFFDVADACLSWVRAVHIAHDLLASGNYRNVIVVNGEFTAYEFGIPEVFRLRSPEQLRYTFPALTIGEAATATVLSASPKRWRFRYRTDASLADLCTLPLPGHKQYADFSEHIGLNGPLQLVSFGAPLTAKALEELQEFIQTTYSSEERRAVKVWLPHAASETLCRIAARRLGLGDAVFSQVFPCYGNVVSASVPAALSMAVESGRLRRGDRVVFCPASAGLSIALVDGIF